MPITAVSADGVSHVFPDGTPPSVIDGAMADYVTAKKSPPKMDLLGDIGAGFAQPFKKLGADVTQDFQATRQSLYNPPPAIWGKIKQGFEGDARALRNLGDILGLASAPIQAMTHPVADLLSRAPIQIYSNPSLQDAIKGRAPKPLNQPEAQTEIENGLMTALAAVPELGARSGRAPTPPVAALAGPSRMAKVLAKAVPDVAQAQGAAQAARAAGIDPTLVDVAGSQGRRLVRALGGKSPEAGEVLENRAKAVAGNTQGAAISATNDLTATKATPDQLAGALAEQQETQASVDYADAYKTPVVITPPTAEALRSTTGQQALGAAKRSAQDLPDGAQVTAELDMLINAAKTDQPFPDVSARALDYVKQQLGGMGRGFQRNPATKARGAGAFNRQAQIEDSLKDVANLAPAREAYKKTQQAIDVLKGPADPFTTNPTDYAHQLSQMADPALQANQVAVRQRLADAIGKGRVGPLGALDTITTAPYATANLQHTFGPAADSYGAKLAALLRQQRNATEVVPSAGSRTAVMASDMDNLDRLQTAGNVVGAGVKAAHGNIIGAAFDAAKIWARTTGIDDKTATEIVTAASDPAQLDHILSMIQQTQGAQAKQQFLQIVGPQLKLLTSGAVSQIPVAAAVGAATDDSRKPLP